MLFSPDGTRLAAGCADNTVRLIDVARRQEVAQAFRDAPEHRGLQVDQFYADYLGRTV